MRLKSLHFYYLHLACLLAIPHSVFALPEDQQEPIDVDADSSSIDQSADGKQILVLRGTLEMPATITQGSMVISGMEIRIVNQNKSTQSITATGNPAHFQQQPASNQELIHASGNTIKLDNQLLTIDDQVEVIQGNNKSSSNHFVYNIETGSHSFSSAPNGERVHMTIEVKKDTP